MIVAGFSSKTDIRKSAEMANEVKERDEGSRKDCQNQGVLFNQRERLFGVQVIPVSSYMYNVMHMNIWLSIILSWPLLEELRYP